MVEKTFFVNNNSRRADVYIKKPHITLEFQHSNISVDEWKDRTNFHLLI